MKSELLHLSDNVVYCLTDGAVHVKRNVTQNCKENKNLQSFWGLDICHKQVHQIMVSAHIGDLEVVDTVLKPREGIAHLSNQIEDFQVGGLALGVVTRILFMGEVMCGQETLDQSISPFGIGLGVMILQVLDAKVKIKRLQVLCFPPGHQAALSRPV